MHKTGSANGSFLGFMRNSCANIPRAATTIRPRPVWRSSRGNWPPGRPRRRRTPSRPTRTSSTATPKVLMQKARSKILDLEVTDIMRTNPGELPPPKRSAARRAAATQWSIFTTTQNTPSRSVTAGPIPSS
jgi:hypothetical protein